MRYTFILILSFVVLFVFRSKAQLNINTTGTVAQWVQNVLVGSGVAVSNITYSGSSQSIGTFTTGATPGNMGISSGLVLSTGNVTTLPGYGSAFSSTSMNGGSDPQLAALITQSINDAAVLQFDFVPVADTLKFQYVFGSEEYPEYVNSINDVFGFFVSGLNPFGGNYVNQNIALIPNSTTVISINSVNNILNSNYYVDNSSGTYVKLDGFTTVLTAWIRVIPCLTYHIKIAIGDASDYIYDSAVFLKENSFMSNIVNVSQTTSANVDTVAVEGCNDAVVTFRLPVVKSTNTIVNFYPGGTAINGLDYDTIPSFVTIPAFQDSVNLTIHPIIDNLTEGLEYIDLIVSTSPCTYETYRIYIKDNQLPVTQLSNDTLICGSGTAFVNSYSTGGYAPYTYLWSTGDSTSSITVNPTVTTTYSLQVSDLCQNDTNASMVVKISLPDFQMDGDSVCFGDSASVSVVTPNQYSYLWSTASTNQQLSVLPNQDTYYSVVVTDSLGCWIQDSSLVHVFPLPLLTTSPDTIICEGHSAQLIAYGNYNFLWDNGSTNASILVSPAQMTNYEITITDSNLCQQKGFVKVEVLPIPMATILSPTDSICLGNTITIAGMGGDQYLWDNGSTAQSIAINPVISTTYSLTVTSNEGATHCSHDTSFTLGVKRCNYFYVPSAFSPDGNGLNDAFGVVGIFEAIEYYQLYIFDRWGRLIFTSLDPLVKWDGKINGVEATQDVYTYQIIIKETYSEQFQLAGTVQLIR